MNLHLIVILSKSPCPVLYLQYFEVSAAFRFRFSRTLRKARQTKWNTLSSPNNISWYGIDV